MEGESLPLPLVTVVWGHSIRAMAGGDAHRQKPTSRASEEAWWSRELRLRRPPRLAAGPASFPLTPQASSSFRTLLAGNSVTCRGKHPNTCSDDSGRLLGLSYGQGFNHSKHMSGGRGRGSYWNELSHNYFSSKALLNISKNISNFRQKDFRGKIWLTTLAKIRSILVELFTLSTPHNLCSNMTNLEIMIFVVKTVQNR